MISLVTSLYHSERHLEAFTKQTLTVGNAMKDSGVLFEIVIVSNDSSPRELEILQGSQKLQPWLRIYSVPREPISASWNRGLNLAKGDVLGFWNVDDIRFPQALIDGYKTIKSGSELVYFPFIYKRYVKLLGIAVLVKVKTIYPPEFERKEFSSSMHTGPFYMFSKRFYELVGPYDEQFRIAQDFEWCARAALKNSFKLSSEIAGIFTNDGTTLSGSKNPRHQAEVNVVYLRYGATHKIVQVPDELMSQYNTKKIKFEFKKII